MSTRPSIFPIANASKPPKAPWSNVISSKLQNQEMMYLPQSQKRNTRKWGGLDLSADTRV